jgi:DNA-binding NarL/FixJ family response regulator
MTTKTIFIISNYPMFSLGLESLLRQKAGLDVIGGYRLTVEQAIEQIEAIRPSIVILDTTGLASDGIAEAVRLLKINPSIKVICLTLSSNTLSIDQINQWNVKGVEDLLQAIENGPSSLTSAPS